MERFVRGHAHHIPYSKLIQEIEKLEKKREKKPLDELEEADLKAFLEYKERYERDYAALGEDGAEAYRLWTLLDGQRIVGFAEIGEISFAAMQFVFDLYEIDEERRRDLFEMIMQIDRIVMEIRRKLTPSGGTNQ